MGYGYYYDPTYILVIIGAIITLIAQIGVKGSYSKYKRINASKMITGREVARRILDANGLDNVQIKEVAGTLSDHYNPSDKTVNLSTDIYKDSSIASIAVAAHECGHAIQDKVGYKLLRFRHSIIPTVNICSKLGYIVVVIGLLFGSFNLAMIGLFLLCTILVFQLVTLPVEFNASHRAREELIKLNLADKGDDSGIKSMLFAAAMTYVASVASTLLQMLRMLLIILNSRRSDD